MKVAVITIGNVRTWDQCKENFKKTFSFLKPDYFMSTYDLQYNYHPYIKGVISYDEDFILPKKQILESFSDLTPKDVSIEVWNVVNQFIESENKKFDESMKNIDSCYSQYRKLKLTLQMVKDQEERQGFKYDFIIKTRFDIIHKPFFPVSDEKEILIDSGNVFPNDCFFMANRDSVFEMSDFMYNEFYKPTKEDSGKNPPHGLLLNAINNSNLKIRSEKIMDHVIRATMIQKY